jgi:spectinomycin phosphotransferase/16S rRNA (guanine(1405)-N(7))-methyltransferase
MLSRPEGLDDRVLVDALERDWALRPTSASYLPVGAGSHHWRVVDVDGGGWFVTVDDLDARREDPDESRSEVFERLATALGTARGLRERGARFVVAPIPSCEGGVLRAVGDQWAVAVYPLVDGEAFRGGQRMPLSDRLAVVDLISRLHTVPPSPAVRPCADDYRLQNRRDLEHAVRDPAGDRGSGPYALPLAQVLTEHGRFIQDMLAAYDDLVAHACTLTERHVPTHGEPHAGNTMRTTEGWVLVDWDTARLAAPERDLWLLEPGDGATTRAYEAATGIEVVAELLDLFRLRWDLADLGVDIARLRAPHATSADDNRAWEGVTHVLSRRSSGDVVPRAAWR